MDPQPQPRTEYAANGEFYRIAPGMIERIAPPASYMSAQDRAAGLLAEFHPKVFDDGGRGWTPGYAITGSLGGQYFLGSNGCVYSPSLERAWCLNVRDDEMPMADIVLSKMLILQADEGLFLRTAR